MYGVRISSKLAGATTAYHSVKYCNRRKVQNKEALIADKRTGMEIGSKMDLDNSVLCTLKANPALDDRDSLH